MITIIQTLDEFLADVGAGNRGSLHSPGSIIDLFKSCLNAEAYVDLNEFERARFEKEFDDGLQFCELFDADHIEPHHLNIFVSYYVVRNVGGTKSFYKACGPLIEKLATWLRDKGHWSDKDYAWFRELIGDGKAGQDLASAYDFGQTLFDHVQMHPAPVPDDLDLIDDADYIEDQCTIRKITPTAIHFENHDAGEIVIRVPKSVTSKAQEDWELLMELARVKGRWYILSCGSVYPH